MDAHYRTMPALGTGGFLSSRNTGHGEEAPTGQEKTVEPHDQGEMDSEDEGEMEDEMEDESEGEIEGVDAFDEDEVEANSSGKRSFLSWEILTTIKGRMGAAYRATKDTPERLAQHRARMAFFNGSGPDLGPEFNPLFTVWEKWATMAQFIKANDIALPCADPEGTRASLLRDFAIHAWSYAVPSKQVLEYMVKRAPDGRIAEVGAGSGYWAKLLQKLGADVVAVDNGSEQETFFCSHFPECKKQDGAEFLAAGGADGRALFLCWPRTEKQNPAVSTFLNNYSGDTIFFVGETDGATFCMLDWVRKHKEQGWFVEKVFPIPTWPSLLDRFMCLSKVAGSKADGSGPVGDELDL